MNLFELLAIAVGLSMDAFAVAICKGLSMPRLSVKNSVIVGLYFGIFQAGMPLFGYFLGVQFKDKIEVIDHWIAFVLLGLIGLNMIKESREREACPADSTLDFKNMCVLAIATSIDALAVGVTFAFLHADIIVAVSTIGVTTFLISVAGVGIGHVFGSRYKARAELMGGIILIGMGVKILAEHLLGL